ncbi:transmembrane protein 42 [Diabrotica virgifera virgifera]|uniref:Transmembrane protein 42 n=1 Tax=Diabrotica virgifera virgifera TaxID=50390 RepID=A0A6P7G2K1_DIAVI|nr:transmembrane protein 42 [Diabrotica virgifera virgifera]
MYKDVHFAFISGGLAATGSAFGKLSGLPDFEGYILIRIIFFALMLSTNTASLTFFVKALQKIASINATLISSATNYIITALFGFLIFKETTSLLWWFGISLIMIGLVLIVSNTTKEDRKGKNE